MSVYDEGGIDIMNNISDKLLLHDIVAQPQTPSSDHHVSPNQDEILEISDSSLDHHGGIKYYHS